MSVKNSRFRASGVGAFSHLTIILAWPNGHTPTGILFVHHVRYRAPHHHHNVLPARRPMSCMVLSICANVAQCDYDILLLAQG